MVQLTIVNDAGSVLCRLNLPATATVAQLTLQVFLVKPELQRSTHTIRNAARGAVSAVNAVQTLQQANLATEASAAETLVFSAHTTTHATSAVGAVGLPASSASSSLAATATASSAGVTASNSTTDVTARILELFGGASTASAAAPHPAPPPPSAPVQRQPPPSAAPPAASDVMDPSLLDPAEAEMQRRLYEYIQQQQIDENLANALEYTPEAFARVIMLYVPCTINQVPIKAFVDSGAQMSIMNRATAERCGLMRLVDKRMRGVAVGVGRQEILGRIHMTPVNLSGMHIPFSFSVIAEQDIDLIIGLDQLKRHQMVIDLKNNCLTIDQVSVPFLPEGDIPKRPGIDEMNEEEEGGDVAAGRDGAEEEEGEDGVAQGSAPPPPPSSAATLAADPFLSPTSPAAAFAGGGAASVLPGNSPSLPAAPSAPTPASASPVGEAEPNGVPRTESEKAARVDSFMAFTGIADRTQAAELLEAVDWDPDAAAAIYFEDA